MIEHRTGRSLRSFLVHTTSRLVVRPTLAVFPMRGPLGRLVPLLDLGASLLPRLPTTSYERVEGPTWKAELVTRTEGRPARGAILYMHGGAFVFGGLGTHRRIVERLAEKTGMPVLAVDYRLYPRGHHADSVADCLEAFAWLEDHGYDAGSIVLAGDSAGGHLAFATALNALREGHGRPAGVIGFSPWLDFDHTTKVAHVNARHDALVPARRLDRLARHVLGTHEIDPALSPVNAPLEGLPPTFLVCAEGETLRVDAELMFERLAAAGVPVTLQVWRGTVHAFPVLGHATPESRAVLDEAATFAVSVARAGRAASVA